jgi:hypothetical protein
LGYQNKLERIASTGQFTLSDLTNQIDAEQISIAAVGAQRSLFRLDLLASCRMTGAKFAIPKISQKSVKYE